MNEHRQAIEAIVMVADEPADPRLLAQLIEVSPQRVDELCEELAAEYDEAGRGFELVKVAGGWRFQSRATMAPYVERFVLTGQSARLSAAALETLSIVAYKQPISRAQVAAIRGVNVDGVMRTLQQRGYIAELARDPGPGQAVLFGTTSLFLERLGLNTLDELPSLGDFVPGPEVVEALEAGLRVPDDAEALDGASEGTQDPGSEAGDDAAAAPEVVEVVAEFAADVDAADAVAEPVDAEAEPVVAEVEARTGEPGEGAAEAVEVVEAVEAEAVEDIEIEAVAEIEADAADAEPVVRDAAELDEFVAELDEVVIDLRDPVADAEPELSLDALDVLADDPR